MTPVDLQPTARPIPGVVDVPVRRTRHLLILSGVAQTLLTVGVIFILLVVYEIWITDVFSNQEQAILAARLHRQWSAEKPAGAQPGSSHGATGPLTPPPVGQPFAFLHIPRLAPDYDRAIVEGTGQDQLAQGPGHYVGTAMPGQAGNFAVAGHRVGTGSPFLDLDVLRPGDPITVETADAWYVYRVLGDAATGDFRSDPSGVAGQEIVHPSDVSVIAPTPDVAGSTPSGRAYLTLTTCNPKFSARTRLIIHAVLDGAPVSKVPASQGPAPHHP